MIFYFSGTGNSLWTARQLSAALGEAEPVAVADELRRAGETGECEYSLKDGEPLILVFPVHSWGPAVLMLRFVERLRRAAGLCRVHLRGYLRLDGPDDAGGP